MAKLAAVALILTWSLVPIAFILVSSFKPSEAAGADIERVK